ncbi:dipeptidase [Paenibacillus sp. y28]|uniref:dipeptidase n=1 Tax=Paenibacillus sp. y28 TaxID=3129110 RepID=UPI0030191085
MRVIDLHCDALFKLWESGGTLDYGRSEELAANRERLIQGGVQVQCYAIFVPPEVKAEHKLQAALDQIHYFYDEVLGRHPDFRHIQAWEDFDKLQDGEIGAMLTLEGAEPIGSDLKQLNILYQLGVRSIGLTWNDANLAADGVLEPRGAGLTVLGKDIVRFNNRHKLFTDVAHLSEKGFWEVMELADYPIASHCNARAVCDHPRNLYDAQAKALFDRDAMIHVVYYPPFVKENGQAALTDLIRHIDHFCSLGGVRNIGLGSDFDGIEQFVDGLEHAGKLPNLMNELLKHYKEEEVRGFASENFLRCRPR